MKKYIPLLIITSLLLSACGFNWSKKEDLFKKKQECLSLSKTIEQRVNENNSLDNSIYSYSFVEIFYSAKKDDCLWILKENRENENWMRIMYFLHSSGTNWIEWNLERCTWFTSLKDSTKDFNDCDLFEQKIEELKWE